MSAAANTPHPVRIRDATLSSRVRSSLSDLVRYRHLVWYMATSSLSVESRGTKFGRSWWIIEPLLLMGVYTVFIGVILHGRGVREPNYPLAILAALISFEFFSRSVDRSMALLRATQSSMLSVSFPRAVVPLAVTISEAIRFVISVAVFIVIAIPFGVMPSSKTALAIPFMVVEFLMTLGAAYFFSATAVFFNDVSKMTDYWFWLLFHLAPGFYPLSLVPVHIRPYLALNPFTTFFQGLRGAILYPGQASLPVTQMAGVTLFAVILCVTGYIYFLRREGSFNKVVL